MKVIHLDASGWRSPDDFYSALLPKLGAPEWHGRNLDALWDSLGGGINAVGPPFVVEVMWTGQLSSDMVMFLAQVAEVFEDTQKEVGEQVIISLQ